jgi:hypothetical protein
MNHEGTKNTKEEGRRKKEEGGHIVFLSSTRSWAKLGKTIASGLLFSL